jgi:prephenate dehydrogenase
MSGGTDGGSGVTSLGRIAIVGTGQVGTMLGMALMAARHGSSPEIDVGQVTLVDERAGVAVESLARGAGDAVGAGAAEAFAEADTLILAVPVPAIVGLIDGLGPTAPAGALVIDTGSTKRPVVEAMRRSIPAAAHAVGGHPMAGTEVPGPAGADPERLRGATFALTPVRDDPAGIARARTLVEIVGARPYEVGADEHDRAVAMTSHLPHLLAFALSVAAERAAAASGGGPSPLISSGFLGASRLAEGDPAATAGFLAANADQVVMAAARFHDAFDALIARIDEPHALERALADARAARRSLTRKGGRR